MFVITASEVIGFIFFAILFIWYAIVLIKEAIVQARCKHDEGVRETMACEAICRRCSKNLGFIGNWRNKS